MAAALTAQGRADEILTLVDAERAFARMSVETTQREAFLANFADDGVWFTPGPANTRAALSKPPSVATNRVLDWDPVTGDVAASGELGYTAGPWIRSERRAGTEAGKPLGTGWFFSVWRRSAGGGWKVLADFGVEAAHTRLLRGQAFRRAEVRASMPKAVPSPAALADDLRAADVEFGRRLTASGWAEALRAGATDDVMAFRDGREPAPGWKAAVVGLPSGPWPCTLQPAYALGAIAGDLGVTYGAYTGGSGAQAVNGFYLHVWKRTPAGWKLAVDVANVALPAGR
jgi:ketosteroid isomerase-like protein